MLSTQDMTFFESHALNITDREYYILDHIELPRTKVRKWWIGSIYMIEIISKSTLESKNVFYCKTSFISI